MDDDQVKLTNSLYLPELDVLRFFAFIAVYIHHTLPHSTEKYQGKLAPFAEIITTSIIAGRFALDVFFVLSAFLITRSLIKESEKTGVVDAKSFYLRRLLRIFPLYYFFILLTIFVLPRSLGGEPLNFFHIFGFLFFIENWVCSFLGLADSVTDPLWSVSVEEQFYLIFPILLMYLGVKRIKLLAVVFLTAAFLMRLLLFFNEASPAAIACNTVARLDSIAIGILLAVLIHENRLKPIKNRLFRYLMISAGIAGLLFSAKFLDWSGVAALFLYPIGAVSSGLILWGFIVNNPLKMKKFASLVYLGKISYGLYVFHLMATRIAVLAFVYFSINQNYFTSWRFFSGLVITILIAIVSYQLLEKPFLKMKDRFAFIRSKPI